MADLIFDDERSVAADSRRQVSLPITHCLCPEKKKLTMSITELGISMLGFWYELILFIDFAI